MGKKKTKGRNGISAGNNSAGVGRPSGDAEATVIVATNQNASESPIEKCPPAQPESFSNVMPLIKPTFSQVTIGNISLESVQQIYAQINIQQKQDPEHAEIPQSKEKEIQQPNIDLPPIEDPQTILVPEENLSDKSLEPNVIPNLQQNDTEVSAKRKRHRSRKHKPKNVCDVANKTTNDNDTKCELIENKPNDTASNPLQLIKALPEIKSVNTKVEINLIETDNVQNEIQAVQQTGKRVRKRNKKKKNNDALNCTDDQDLNVEATNNFMKDNQEITNVIKPEQIDASAAITTIEKDVEPEDEVPLSWSEEVNAQESKRLQEADSQPLVKSEVEQELKRGNKKSPKKSKKGHQQDIVNNEKPDEEINVSANENKMTNELIESSPVVAEPSDDVLNESADQLASVESSNTDKNLKVVRDLKNDNEKSNKKSKKGNKKDNVETVASKQIKHVYSKEEKDKVPEIQECDVIAETVLSDDIVNKTITIAEPSSISEDICEIKSNFSEDVQIASLESPSFEKVDNVKSLIAETVLSDIVDKIEILEVTPIAESLNTISNNSPTDQPKLPEASVEFLTLKKFVEVVPNYLKKGQDKTKNKSKKGNKKDNVENVTLIEVKNIPKEEKDALSDVLKEGDLIAETVKSDIVNEQILLDAVLIAEPISKEIFDNQSNLPLAESTNIKDNDDKLEISKNLKNEKPNKKSKKCHHNEVIETVTSNKKVSESLPVAEPLIAIVDEIVDVPIEEPPKTIHTETLDEKLELLEPSTITKDMEPSIPVEGKSDEATDFKRDNKKSQKKSKKGQKDIVSIEKPKKEISVESTDGIALSEPASSPKPVELMDHSNAKSKIQNSIQTSSESSITNLNEPIDQKVESEFLGPVLPGQLATEEQKVVISVLKGELSAKDIEDVDLLFASIVKTSAEETDKIAVALENPTSSDGENLESSKTESTEISSPIIDINEHNLILKDENNESEVMEESGTQNLTLETASKDEKLISNDENTELLPADVSNSNGKAHNEEKAHPQSIPIVETTSKNEDNNKKGKTGKGKHKSKSKNNEKNENKDDALSQLKEIAKEDEIDSKNLKESGFAQSAKPDRVEPLEPKKEDAAANKQTGTIKKISKEKQCKPEVPPRPEHLKNRKQQNKSECDTKSVITESSKPQEISQTKLSQQQRTPQQLFDDEDDDDEMVEFKFSPREVFLATNCQICKTPLKTLIQCEKCSMVSYCSIGHLKEDAEKHQGLCLAIQEIARKRGGHMYNNARILNDDDFRSLRVHTLNLIEQFLKKALLPCEREILLFPRLCCTRSCREWRPHLLKECESCGQVSFCAAKPEHLLESHSQWCKVYSLYQKLVVRQKHHGLIEPALPTRILMKPFQLPKTMDEIFKELYKNQSSLKDECIYAALTQLATAPLTALAGLHNGGQVVGEVYTIHLVGAELQFEADTLDKWEAFFLHLVPQLIELRVVFIGPELNVEKLPLEILSRIRMCRTCRQACRVVKFDFQCGKLYHKYVESTAFTPPDLICFFNPGLYRFTGFNGTDTWPLTIKAATSFNCPVIVTSYTEYESPQDLKRLQAESIRPLNNIVAPGRNPYASQRPERNFISDEIVPMIFKNYYYFIIN